MATELWTAASMLEGGVVARVVRTPEGGARSERFDPETGSWTREFAPAVAEVDMRGRPVTREVLAAWGIPDCDFEKIIDGISAVVDDVSGAQVEWVENANLGTDLKAVAVERKIQSAEDGISAMLDSIPGAHIDGARGAKLGMDLKSSSQGGRDRIYEKMLKGGRQPHSIADYLRARIAVDDEATLRHLADRLIERFGLAGDPSIMVSDFLDIPCYRAVHLQLRAPSGELSFEVQLMPTPIAKIWEASLQAVYERYRAFDEIRPEIYAQYQSERIAAEQLASQRFAEWPRGLADATQLP